MKKLLAIALSIGLLTFVSVMESDGRGGSRSFSSSRSSFSRSSSSWGRSSSKSSSSWGSSWGKSKSYSKPKSPIKKASYSKPKSIGKKTTNYSKPGKNKPGYGKSSSGKIKTPKATKSQRKVNKQNSAKILKNRKAKLNKQRSSKSFKSKVGNKSYNKKGINKSRNNYRRQWRQQHPNVIVVQTSSYGYGGYGPSFVDMWMYDSLFGYNHRDDMEYRRWRREMDAQSLENEKLKLQMAALDKQMNAMTGPRNVEYVPANVPAEVIYNDDVLMNKVTTPPVIFATGLREGMYYAFCEGNDTSIAGFKKDTNSELNVSCIKTTGSKDNVIGFLNGKYDAILAQSDVIDGILRRKNKSKIGPFQKVAYQEPFWLMVHDDSGIDDIDDLKKKASILYIGKIGSGTNASWKNIIHHDPTLKTINAQPMKYLLSAVKVSKDKTVAALIVMGMGSRLIDTIDKAFGDKVKLIPFYKKELTKIVDREGNPVYRTCTVPEKYKDLQNGSVKTLCADAVLAVSQKWISQNGPGAEEAFVSAAAYTIGDVQSVVGGL